MTFIKFLTNNELEIMMIIWQSNQLLTKEDLLNRIRSPMDPRFVQLLISFLILRRFIQRRQNKYIPLITMETYFTQV